MDRVKVIAEARTYLGTPWRYQGRGRHGIDCVGLIVAICALTEFPFADHTDYPLPPKRGQLERELRLNLNFTGQGMHAGGVVLLKTRLTYPSHCAIFTGDSIIHGLEGRGIVEHPFPARGPFQFVAGFTFRGVMY